MSLFGKKASQRCPICGGNGFYPVPVGRADTWNQQVGPHWKQYRGLPVNAAVAFSEPRLEWDQPTFDRAPGPTEHRRCSRCSSLVPPQFLSDTKSKALLITAGMPAAGKTTWLKCLFAPASERHLVIQPSTFISRVAYRYVEPYTIANPDPRTAVPVLLHGMELTFQRQRIDVAGIDVKGEVFHQQATTPDKYMRVLDILDNLRSMPFSQFLVMFVVPFDPTLSRQNIGQLTSHLIHRPGSRGTWQGVIWTHLDLARLRDEQELFGFLQSSEPALALAQRVVAEADDVFDGPFIARIAEVERLVQGVRSWSGRQDLLESLTWLLYRLMTAYSALPLRFRTGKAEFYYSFQGGAGQKIVRQCMRLAAALFAAWDTAGRGDFAGMILETMRSDSDHRFPVLPCGIEFMQSSAPGDDGLPVWGDLLLVEILRRHAV